MSLVDDDDSKAAPLAVIETTLCRCVRALLLLKTGPLAQPHHELIIDFFIIPTLHVDLLQALKHTVIRLFISYSA